MGRKPNALVSEFFYRGSKLPDSSNRYEHTCKLCGENFPKGRPDSLLGHLTKACQAISIADKQRVNLSLRGVSARGTYKRSHGNECRDRSRASNIPYNSRTTPFGPVGGLNGLNVLAEASRQVGATGDVEQTAGLIQGQKAIVVDPALENAGSSILDLNEHFAVSPSHFLAGDESPRTARILQGSTNLSDIRHSSQLSLIAASANEMVSENAGHDIPSNQHPLELHSDLFEAQNPTIYPRPIAVNSNQQTREAASTGRPIPKQKSRSAFSEERRKEVQLVRKMGACLRCRMLKKTCSPGMPCSQCKGLQNPRVWMECCIRTRLVTRLEVYSVSLHSILAYHDINNIKRQMSFEALPGYIEATHFETDTPGFVNFGALYAQRQTLPNLNAHLPISSHDPELGLQSQDVHILDGEIEELSEKLDVYMKKVSHEFFNCEESVFIKQTLIFAANLGSTCQDELLDGVLDLWVTTSILVGPILPWRIFLNSTLPPPTTTHALVSDSSGWRIPISGTDEYESYSLISSQLKAAAEKRAARISRSVLNRIEQRLLQKQKDGNFRTFLASLILLNCVERMSWLFYAWEHGEFAHKWPLERRPSDLAAQGDRFSTIVATHLKMRSLAPSFCIQADTDMLEAKSGSEHNVHQWFEAVKISHSALFSRQTAGLDLNDWRSLDLKFCSSLILSSGS